MNKTNDLADLLLRIFVLENLLSETRELAEEYARNMTKSEIAKAYEKLKSSLANQD